MLQPALASGRTDSGAAAGRGAVPGGAGALGPVRPGDTASRRACSFCSDEMQVQESVL